MNARLADKVVIVTGSGQGIGKGIALRLAAEGAAVVVAEFNEDTAGAAVSEIEAGGGRAMAYQIDISDVPAIERMTAAVASEFGHIDMLVNNAGVVQTKPMMELTETDWDRVLNVNMRGTFFCIQTVARKMIEQLPEEIARAGAPADLISMGDKKEVPAERPAKSFGKIVSLSSISGRRGRPLSTHYAAVAFLCSSDADYITGQTLNVDGGFEMD